MKDKWRNYALKDGKISQSYIREYSNRSPKREAREASRSNSLLESRQEPEKVEHKISMTPLITNDEWIYRMRSTNGIDREREESRDNQAQSGSSERLIRDMPSVSGEQDRRRRETVNHQDTDEGIHGITKTGNSLKVRENEDKREEDVSETHQERRQGVSFPDQRRCEVEETDPKIQTREEIVKKATKEKKHEAKESKAYEKKEDKKEAKSKKK